MHSTLLALLLVHLLGTPAAKAALVQVASQFPTPDNVYTSQDPTGGAVVLAPNAALQDGGVVLVGQQRQASAEACAAACRARPACTWFEYCQAETCAVQGAPLAQDGCRLLTSNCTQPEQLQQTQNVATGFPVRMPDITVAGFSSVAGQGIAGADYVCGASVVPGKCALQSTEEALIYCLATAECRAVTIFRNGTDGCSDQPLNFLKTEGLAPANTFIASGVVTLQPPAARDVVDTQLTESEGQVIVPSDAELAAAPTNVDPATDTTWRGCLMGAKTVMAGKVLTVLNDVASPEACCQQCRKRYGPSGCNVWNYCGQAGGCSYKGPMMVEALTLQAGQCQLRYQDTVSVKVGWAPSLLAHGDGVPFTAGAPLAVSGPAAAAVPGWQPLPGRSVLASTSAVCTVDGLSDGGECVDSSLAGIGEMAGWCMANPLCAAFNPQGSDQGVFQEATSASARLLNPSGLMFVKDEEVYAAQNAATESSSGGLSGGAIAGIVVGSVAAAVLLALGLFFGIKARQHRVTATAQSQGNAGMASAMLPPPSDSNSAEDIKDQP